MTFAINVDSNFCKYVNASGNQCIMWLKGETFYILELFSDELIFKNEPIFEALKLLYAPKKYKDLKKKIYLVYLLMNIKKDLLNLLKEKLIQKVI